MKLYLLVVILTAVHLNHNFFCNQMKHVLVDLILTKMWGTVKFVYVLPPFYFHTIIR